MNGVNGELGMTPGPLSTPASPPQRPLWSRILRYLLALFTLEVGLFLLIFPWTDPWTLNNLQDTNAVLRDLWQDPYFRGAISGLGAVNIYLAILEFSRTLRNI